MDRPPTKGARTYLMTKRILAFALEGLGYEVDRVAKALRPATPYLLGGPP